MKKFIEKLRNFLSETTLGYIIVMLLIFFYWYGIIYLNKTYNSKETQNTEDSDVLKIMEAIKKVESEEPSRISENPTEEEIYNSDYIKHIRVALDRYLKDPKSEVDASLSEPLDSGNECGLGSFDKSYYKSKFIVFFAQDNDYGGVQTYLFSIDKPDILFWAWVYKAGEEYQLRAFCESGSMFENKTQFEDFAKGMIKSSKYSL
ncbi:MAG: hypothetical protein ABIG99_00850 [Patescibacteria group bacterium]